MTPHLTAFFIGLGVGGVYALVAMACQMRYDQPLVSGTYTSNDPIPQSW
jgi:hypothetical protein